MEGNENFIHSVEVAASSKFGHDDSRINCTDNQSLRTIVDITCDQISELASSCNSPELISYFRDTFKNVLQENVLLNGLPFRSEKSSKLTSTEKEDHIQMVDDALFSKLSKTVSEVANKRKFCPEQCCRILNIGLKHDLQNLKKAKVVCKCEPENTTDDEPSTSSVISSKDRIKNFSEFCETFNPTREVVQCKIEDLKNLRTEIRLASDIKKQQRLHFNSGDNVDITQK